MSGQPKPKNNTWLQWHNLLELLRQPVQTGNSLSASAANLQITLEFLEFTSWHPWKIAVSSHWYWWTKQDLKHSHRFNMFIYEVTQCNPSTGNSTPQAQHSCSRITYFVIPMALKETGYERESYLYTPCCRFLFEKASACLISNHTNALRCCRTCLVNVMLQRVHQHASEMAAKSQHALPWIKFYFCSKPLGCCSCFQKLYMCVWL